MLAILRGIFQEINRRHYFRQPFYYRKPWGDRVTEIETLPPMPRGFNFGKKLYADMEKQLIQDVSIQRQSIIDTENLSWIEIATKQQQAKVDLTKNGN